MEAFLSPVPSRKKRQSSVSASSRNNGTKSKKRAGHADHGMKQRPQQAKRKRQSLAQTATSSSLIHHFSKVPKPTPPCHPEETDNPLTRPDGGKGQPGSATFLTPGTAPSAAARMARQTVDDSQTSKLVSTAKEADLDQCSDEDMVSTPSGSPIKSARPNTDKDSRVEQQVEGQQEKNVVVQKPNEGNNKTAFLVSLNPPVGENAQPSVLKARSANLVFSDLSPSIPLPENLVKNHVASKSNSCAGVPAVVFPPPAQSVLMETNDIAAEVGTLSLPSEDMSARRKLEIEPVAPHSSPEVKNAPKAQAENFHRKNSLSHTPIIYAPYPVPPRLFDETTQDLLPSVKAAMEEIFGRFDLNGDGMLSLSEFRNLFKITNPSDVLTSDAFNAVRLLVPEESPRGTRPGFCSVESYIQLYLGTYLSHGTNAGDIDLWKDLQALGYVPTFLKEFNQKKKLSEKKETSSTSNKSGAEMPELADASWFHDPPVDGDPKGVYPRPDGMRLERFTDVNGVSFYIAAADESAKRIAAKLGVNGGAKRIVEANCQYLDGLNLNSTFREGTLLRVPIDGVEYAKPASLEVPQPNSEKVDQMKHDLIKSQAKIGGVSAKNIANFLAGSKQKNPKDSTHVEDEVVTVVESDPLPITLDDSDNSRCSGNITGIKLSVTDPSKRAEYENFLLSSKKLFLTPAQRTERALIIKARKQREAEAAAEEKKRLEEKKHAEKKQAAEQKRLAKEKLLAEKKRAAMEKKAIKEKLQAERERLAKEKKAARDKLRAERKLAAEEKKAKKKKSKNKKIPSAKKEPSGVYSQEDASERQKRRPDSLACIGMKRKKVESDKDASSENSSLLEKEEESFPTPTSPERKKNKTIPAVPTSPNSYRKWLLCSNPFFLSAKQKNERTQILRKESAQKSLKAEIAQRRRETSALFGCNTPEGAKRGIQSEERGTGNTSKENNHLPYQQKKKRVAAIFESAAGTSSSRGSSVQMNSTSIQSHGIQSGLKISLEETDKGWVVRSIEDGQILDIFERSDWSFPPSGAWTLPAFPVNCVGTTKHDYASIGQRSDGTKTAVQWPPQYSYDDTLDYQNHTSTQSTLEVMSPFSKEKLKDFDSAIDDNSPSSNVIDLSLDSSKKPRLNNKQTIIIEADDVQACTASDGTDNPTVPMMLSLSPSVVHSFVHRGSKCDSMIEFALLEYKKIVGEEQAFARTYALGVTAHHSKQAKTVDSQHVRNLFEYILKRRFVVNSSQQANHMEKPVDASFKSKTAAAVSLASESTRLPPLRSAVDMMWTDKYRPKLTSQLCGNDEPRSIFCKWLSEWTPEAAAAAAAEAARIAACAQVDEDTDTLTRKRSCKTGKNARKRTRYYDYSSDEDFGSVGQPALANVMCIVGPTGCGKTSAVYACASELCYNVIEVNAGDTNGRGRKQILSQFGEATTSHRISVPVTKKPSVVDLSATGKDSIFGTRKKSKKQSKKSNTRKRKDSERSKTKAASNLQENPAKAKNTLILFEEVDHIPLFDDHGYDSGFFAAVKQLASTSKRPIVLTATHLTHHLQKALDTLYAGYANKASNILFFSSPSVPQVVLHTRLICAAEFGYSKDEKTATEKPFSSRMPETRDLVMLARASGCDIRAIINALQVWCQSPYPPVASQEEIISMAIDNVESDLNSPGRKGAKGRRRNGAPKKITASTRKRTSKRKAAAAAASIAKILPDKQIRIASMSGVSMPNLLDSKTALKEPIVSCWVGRMLGIHNNSMSDASKGDACELASIGSFLASNALLKYDGHHGAANSNWTQTLSLPFLFDLVYEEMAKDGSHESKMKLVDTQRLHTNKVPLVHNVSPVLGSVTGGTEITITGKNFLSTDMMDRSETCHEGLKHGGTPPIQVRIGSLLCPKVVVVSDTELRAVTPYRLSSKTEVKEDLEYDAWESWQLSTQKRRLQKRFKWIPPGVVEVSVTRENGARQYSSLRNSSSFEASACNQPLFIWIDDEDEKRKVFDDSESWFESSEDSDECGDKLGSKVSNYILKQLEEPLSSYVVCEAHPLAFWSKGRSDNGEKKMLRVTGFAPNCTANMMKYLEGTIGSRLLTINGEAAVAHDKDELMQMLNNASAPASIGFDFTNNASSDESENGEGDTDAETYSLPGASFSEASNGIYSVVYLVARLGLLIANDRGRGLYVKNVLPDGVSVNANISRGDKIISVAGVPVSDTCTVDDFITLVHSKERPLTVEFMQRKRVREIHKAKQELINSKRKVELEAKLKETEDIRNNQLLVQTGETPTAISFELDVSRIPEIMKEQANSPQSERSSPGKSIGKTYVYDPLEAVCQISSDLSLCDMIETRAARGYTYGVSGAERACPRARWQHGLWAHDLDTTNTNCKGGHSLIGSTWSDSIDPLAGCALNGGGKYAGSAGEYDCLDASSANVQGSAVHDLLCARSAEISATMQYFSVRDFESHLQSPDGSQRRDKEQVTLQASCTSCMPKSFLVSSMGRRLRFAMYCRLARSVVSTHQIGYLGANGLLQGPKLRGGKNAASFSGAPGATCTSGGMAVNDVVGFLRTIATLEMTRKSQSVSRRFTHEFDRKGLAVSNIDRDGLAAIGNILSFPMSSLNAEGDEVSTRNSNEEQELM